MARVRSLNASPPRLAGIGPVHQSRHVKRAQTAGCIEIRDGSFNLPLSQLQHAPVVVGLAITWPKTDRFVEVANCVRPVAEGDIGRSAVVVGFAVIAAKCNRPIKIQYRFVLLAFCRKGSSISMDHRDEVVSRIQGRQWRGHVLAARSRRCRDRYKSWRNQG